MSAGTGTGPFRSAYAAALLDYLLEPSEASLRVAYELGREAVSRSLNVLELADAHQQALMSVLLDASDAAEAQAIARAAGDFFLEGLSTFEMVQRGFAEARQAALLERRQTRLSRQLSTFLADASLALDASESLEEMLRLVAEQARELVGADCCVATVAVGGRPRTAEGASYQEDERRWTTFIRWLDLLAIYRVVRQSGGSVRIAGAQLARLHPFCTADNARPLRGWLAASLTALDGSELGAIQLFDKQGAGFTVDDEAALVHLAQMTSAAVERARLYHERS
ncbi:MAG: phosphatase RsbU N-terminal domain-containing protein [Solirubrobacteraceae bacterium]